MKASEDREPTIDEKAVESEKNPPPTMSRKPRFPLTCEKGKNHPPPLFFGENGGGLVGRSDGGICFCHCGDRMRKGGFSTREMGVEGWKKGGGLTKMGVFSLRGVVFPSVVLEKHN